MSWLAIGVDLATIALLLAGTFFTLVSAIGLLRLPDVYSRMHAAGKAGSLGVVLLILAPGVFLASTEPLVTLRAVLAVIFQLLTTPAATYLLAHASYVRSYPSHRGTAVDELRQWIPTYPDDDFGNE
jgi:multicomponent Na+:H+ antiporter subunit G